MGIIKTVTITLIVCIAAVCAINAPDRALRPEVKEITSAVDELAQLGGKAGANNAYFAVLGFVSPENVDIAKEGKRIHEQHYTSVQEGYPDNNESKQASLSFVKHSDIPQCKSEESNCLAFYERNGEKHKQLVKNNRLILERYAQLGSYSEYRDLMRLNPWKSPADLSSAIYSAHALSAAEAAYLFNNGKQQKAVEMMVADIQLWRRFLGGSADIVGKTFSMISLRGNYTLLNEMISSFPANIELPDLGNAPAPLTEDEKSLDLVFDGYLQQLSWILNHNRWPFSQKKMTLGERYFLKSNATLNKAYPIFAALKRAAKATPDQLEQELSALNEKIQHARHKGIDMVYNPRGKQFIASAFDSYVASDWNTKVQFLSDMIRATDK
ncbi:MAG: hypothetical protein OEM02_03335 [Desulfobulbaceae bacterium]|nr:hypothetical protein [Desulfobulbaceae bacterium]